MIDRDPRTFPIGGAFFVKNPNVNDILDNTGTIFGYQDFINATGIEINFVDFYSLLHSIPREWRLGYTDKLEDSMVKQDVLENIIKSKKVCKIIYSKLVQNINYKRSHLEKWNKVLNENFDEKIWTVFFRNNFRCTVESKMRSFQ